MTSSSPIQPAKNAKIQQSDAIPFSSKLDPQSNWQHGLLASPHSEFYQPDKPLNEASAQETTIEDDATTFDPARQDILASISTACSEKIAAFLAEFAEGIVAIQSSMETWDYNSDDVALIHQLAAESDVALYSLYVSVREDWTVQEIVQLLEQCEDLVEKLLPHPTVCKQVLLPRFRATFPVRLYASAILTLTKCEDATNPKVVDWILGTAFQPCELVLVGELTAACTMILTKNEDALTANCFSNSNSHSLLEKVMRQAAGWSPICVASFLSGVFESCTSSHEMAKILLEIYPSKQQYEQVHGDLSFMLQSLRKMPLSPIGDFEAFVHTLVEKYSAKDSFAVCCYLGIPSTARQSENGTNITNHLHDDPTINQCMLNAIVNGSCPLHVDLAYQMVSPTHAPAALSLFRFGYENTLSLTSGYQLSWRLNDWRTFDSPSTAMKKVAGVVRKVSQQLVLERRQKASSPSTPEGALDDELIDRLFYELGEIDFGFLDPNDFDKAENQYAALPDQEDVLEESIDVDAEPDEADNEAFAAGPNKLDFHADDDFLQMCLTQLDAADGNVDDVNIEMLVDELMNRRAANSSSAL